jgi:LemA protein
MLSHFSLFAAPANRVPPAYRGNPDIASKSPRSLQMVPDCDSRYDTQKFHNDALCCHSQGGSHMSRPAPSPSVLQPAALLLFAFLLAGCGINNIPAYDEQVKADWSQGLNQYQRRAELVPNLVETVKGYAAHEKEVLTEVVEARARVGQMQLPDNILSNPEAFRQFQASQDALGSALSRLLVVVERYPELKANQSFLALQSQLEGTENRIAVARRDYINAVKRYNTELRTIPGRWWKALLYPDSELHENFTVAGEVQQVPKVEF